MRLLIGLGNPGAQYAGTRHNVGFAALEVLALRHGLQMTKSRFKSLVSRGRIKGVDVMLAMPQTYMNLSGEAVRLITDYFRIELEDILVLHDDMDIEVGRLKVAARGRSGGHKGIASLIQHLGRENFGRIKIGVGRPRAGDRAENHVLSSFPPQEREDMEQVLEDAADAATIFITEGVAETQALYNRRALYIKSD